MKVERVARPVAKTAKTRKAEDLEGKDQHRNYRMTI